MLTLNINTSSSIVAYRGGGPGAEANPCPDELLQLYFSSFEARIANDEKYDYLWKINMCENEHFD